MPPFFIDGLTRMKKRILFYYDNFCGADARGGTEVATFRIASALKSKGVDVFNAFRSKGDGKEKSIYHDVIKLSRNNRKFVSDLARFIRENEIDVAVNMSRFFRHSLISEASKKSGRDVRVFFMQHFAPGSEKKKGTYAAGFHLLKLNPLNPLYWLRASFYPLLKLPRTLRWKKIYRDIYDTSDRVILLSKGYFDSYKRIAGISDDKKFQAVPNIYNPDKGMDITALVEKKEKRVLMLSRMDEVQKRISLGLKIWKEIEKEEDLNDWCLDIVGTGHDMACEKRLAKSLGLRRVSFHGWQPPRKFLENDSILMMTSEYEGLPLSLIEAQAYGCVPIAYDSFASLRDVVEDGITGVVVEKFGDTENFAGKLKQLMRNKDYRQKMAEEAWKASGRFSSENIVSKWLNLL